MNEQLPVQLSFDVSLPERAQRIRDLIGTARTCFIEIGRELIELKVYLHTLAKRVVASPFALGRQI